MSDPSRGAAEEGAGWLYLIGLGGNVFNARHGQPRARIATTFELLDEAPLRLVARSTIVQSAPLGPSRRRFANGAALVRTALPPPVLLSHLQRMERNAGRRRGQRWGARPLDLDIILWSGGIWRSPELTIPHASFCERLFVLAPAREIAAAWRHPISGRTIAQLHRRLARPKPLDRLAPSF